MSAIFEPESLHLRGTGSVPNNPRCALLHYKNVCSGDAQTIASTFEAMFAANGWPPAWRNGVFAHHHFHTTAHEVLGVYSGSAEVTVGGEGGEVVAIAAGDVVVVPAGVGHCKRSCDGRLGIVGAYPEGQSPDMCTPDASRYADRCDTVSRVQLPRADPVLGSDGPLLECWHS